MSRVHACLAYREGGFHLEDLRSKFGTLVEVKRRLVVDSALAVQVGRSNLELAVHRPWRLFPSCCSVTFSPFDVYSLSMPVLPVNTGIPLSVENPGVFDENIFGANSSLEEEPHLLELPSVELAEKPIRSRRNVHSIG